MNSIQCTRIRPFWAEKPFNNQIKVREDFVPSKTSFLPLSLNALALSIQLRVLVFQTELQLRPLAACGRNHIPFIINFRSRPRDTTLRLAGLLIRLAA